MRTIYEKYAELLVHYSLELKKGEKFLITSTYLSEPLILEVFKEALRAGAHPETRISVNGPTKALYDRGSDPQLQYVSPMFFHAVENYQAFLTIRAPFNTRELESVDPERIGKVSLAETDLWKLYKQRTASGSLKWSLCVFPTDAQAQECGMARDDYQQFVYSACFLDEEDPPAKWREIHDSQQRLVEFLNRRKRIRFRGKDIDISFSTKGRSWINSDGRHNMPSGEIFTSPVEDSVNGQVRFSYPGIYMGQEIEDVRLEVRGGLVTSWGASKGQELLNSLLAVPGANRFGEAAMGTNKGISRFTKNMLFDEKIHGTIHMALGSSFGEAGGRNESPVHWDLLADMKEGGEICADEEVIYRNGEFLI